VLCVDLHTHSVASPDGSLRTADYHRMLASGKLDYIAVTDHDRIDFALKLRAKLGEHIIVGEEISTQAGEIIGLFLSEPIAAGLTPAETVTHIHEQGGLVYVPHPFETVRKGLSEAALATIASQVDIMETYNGRSLQNHSKLAAQWATEHNVVGAASSDAHGLRGWGNTCSTVTEAPTRESLLKALQTAQLQTKSTGVIGRLYPKLNRLRKWTQRV